MTTGFHTREYTLDNTYSVRVFETLEGFLSLRETWDQVLRIHGAHEPFLCHDWYRIWLKYFLSDANLLIIILYRDMVPILIAPLVLKKERYKRVAIVRKIEFIGNIHSPIKNFIYGDSSKAVQKVLLDCLFKFLINIFIDWDIIELESIPEEQCFFDIIKESAAKINLPYRQYHCFNDWRLENVSFNGTDYFSNRTKNCKKEIRRRSRRLEEEGSIEIDITNDKFDYEQYSKIYQDVRLNSWKSPEKDCAFLDEYRRFAMSRSWLRFSVILLNDRPLSCHIRMINNGTAYLMESVYDMEYKDFSPTTILRSELLVYLIDEEKITTIDTIRGDEEYKKEWTPTKRERKGITLFNNTTKGRFMSFIMLNILPVFKKANRYCRKSTNPPAIHNEM